MSDGMRRALVVGSAVALLWPITSVWATEPELQTKVIWASQCLGEPPGQNRSVLLASLAVALGTKVIGGAVDSAATALKAAGEKKELVRSTASVRTSPYEVTEKSDLRMSVEHGCITVVRGRFDPPKDDVPVDSGLTGSIYGMRDPVLRFSAKVTPLKGEPFFVLEPVYLQVPRFEESALWAPNHRDYSIAISLLAPGGTSPFASATFSFLNLEAAQEYRREHPMLASSSSGPLAAPPVPESAKKAQAKLEGYLAPYLLAADVIAGELNVPKWPRLDPIPTVPTVAMAKRNLCAEIRKYNLTTMKQFAMNDEVCASAVAEKRALQDRAQGDATNDKEMRDWAKAKICPSPQVSLEKDPIYKGDKRADVACPLPQPVPFDATKRYGNMFTQVTVVETRPGNKFAGFLGTVLSGAKDDVTAALSKELIPKLRKDAADAEAITDRATQRNIQLADLAVLQAEQQLQEAQLEDPRVESAVTAARVAVIKTKAAANDAYRAAGQAVPYPELL